MNAHEKALLAKLGECANEFAALGPQHPADPADFAFHIHALQNIVMARGMARQHPDVCTQAKR